MWFKASGEFLSSMVKKSNFTIIEVGNFILIDLSNWFTIYLVQMACIYILNNYLMTSGLHCTLNCKTIKYIE